MAKPLYWRVRSKVAQQVDLLIRLLLIRALLGLGHSVPRDLDAFNCTHDVSGRDVQPGLTCGTIVRQKMADRFICLATDPATASVRSVVEGAPAQAFENLYLLGVLSGVCRESSSHLWCLRVRGLACEAEGHASRLCRPPGQLGGWFLPSCTSLARHAASQATWAGLGLFARDFEGDTLRPTLKHRQRGGSWRPKKTLASPSPSCHTPVRISRRVSGLSTRQPCLHFLAKRTGGTQKLAPGHAAD